MAIHKRKKQSLCQPRVCAKVKLGGWGGGKCPSNIFCTYEEFFWPLSWRGTNKKHWSKSWVKGNVCVYVCMKDRFKSFFPLFLMWLPPQIKLPNTHVQFWFPSSQCYQTSYTYGFVHRCICCYVVVNFVIIFITQFGNMQNVKATNSNSIKQSYLLWIPLTTHIHYKSKDFHHHYITWKHVHDP